MAWTRLCRCMVRSNAPVSDSRRLIAGTRGVARGGVPPHPRRVSSVRRQQLVDRRVVVGQRLRGAGERGDGVGTGQQGQLRRPARERPSHGVDRQVRRGGEHHEVPAAAAGERVRRRDDRDGPEDGRDRRDLRPRERQRRVIDDVEHVHAARPQDAAHLLDDLAGREVPGHGELAEGIPDHQGVLRGEGSPKLQVRSRLLRLQDTPWPLPDGTGCGSPTVANGAALLPLR